MARWTLENMPTQNGRVAMVTGANSGIGFETARELARKGAEVVLGCRSPERGEAAVSRLLEEQPEAKVSFALLDLSDLDQVSEHAAGVSERYERLDLLINNAGVMVPPFGKTQQGFELQIGVNHLGHFALTGRLLPLLLRTPGARVVNVSSVAHRSGKMDFEDLHWEHKPYKPWAAYSQSKLANLLFTFELQRRLDGCGVVTVAAHPGYTATNLQKNALMWRLLNPFLAMPTAQGALPTLYAATDPSITGGEYIGPDGFMEVRGYPQRAGTAAAATRTDDAARLFEISEKLTGVTFDLGPVRGRAVGNG